MANPDHRIAHDMSTYEPKSDSTNAICPYCGHAYQVEGEDFAEDGREETCDECGKTFFLETSVDVTHTATPNCALNGVDHRWGDWTLREWMKYRTCNSCGKLDCVETPSGAQSR